MRALYLRHGKADEWCTYWETFGVDREEFVRTDIYPIDVALDYVKKDQDILECGFGGGRVIRHLATHGYRVRGIERDGEIVAALKRADPSLPICRGDALNLPFADHSFDTSLCFGVVAGLQTGLARAVWELKRVTRPNGTVVLSVMLDNFARSMQSLLQVGRRKTREFYAWMDEGAGWANYFRSFAFEIIDARPIVSRYNIYYQARFLRARAPCDMSRARTDESEFKLNAAGAAFWLLHRTLGREMLASGTTFALRNEVV